MSFSDPLHTRLTCKFILELFFILFIRVLLKTSPWIDHCLPEYYSYHCFLEQYFYVDHFQLYSSYFCPFGQYSNVDHGLNLELIIVLLNIILTLIIVLCKIMFLILSLSS